MDNKAKAKNGDFVTATMENGYLVQGIKYGDIVITESGEIYEVLSIDNIVPDENILLNSTYSFVQNLRKWMDIK